MFENDVPKHKIGMLQPLALIDNTPYEFYRLAPPRVRFCLRRALLRPFTSPRARRDCSNERRARQRAT